LLLSYPVSQLIYIQGNVREYLDSLLGLHNNPFLDEEEAEDFAESIEDSPELHCCTTHNFQIDINRGAQSPWNTSAGLH
jgi:hypothetical protein